MFKLEKLHMDSYKNLSRDFDFSNNKGYIALIGLNGSGKSNLLEAISIIFDKLINNNGYNISFDYSIEYELNGHIYTRKKREAKKDGTKCSPKELEYPTNLIACYSGEDTRLWNVAFRNYYMGYFNDAVKEVYSSPTFLYIDKYCWSIALISLVCSNNSDVKDFLLNALKINSPEDVEIDFAIDDTKKNIFNAHSALNWFNRITQDGLEEINMNTIATSDIYVNAHQVPESEKAKYIFNFLYLLSQPKKDNKDENGKPKKNGKRNNIDKLINRIKIRVNSNGTSIDFNDLSEGQKKLILIECITKVLGDENSLVLLDEPDAHTHIALKKELLSGISNFKGQVVLTTHSPIFVDMMRFNNLVYLEKGNPIDMNKIQAIKEISDNQINVLDSALISSSKKLLITEGPEDVIHLEKAIDILSQKYDRFKPLANDVAIVFQGGAKMVNEYYRSVLSGMYDNIEKTVFVFDHDSEGRDGAKMVTTLAKDKIDYLFYEKEYPIKSTDIDFYLEDFYPNTFYSDINLPQIEGKPLYRQMKKMNTLASSVKDKIKKNIKSENIDSKYFEGFTNFLDELLKKFGKPHAN